MIRLAETESGRLKFCLKLIQKYFSVHRGALLTKGVIKKFANSQKNTCARASFLIKLQTSIKKEALAQVLSCEFCAIFKNTYLEEYLRTAPSEPKLMQPKF